MPEITNDIIFNGFSLGLILLVIVQALREAGRLDGRFLPLLALAVGVALVSLTLLPEPYAATLIRGLGLGSAVAVAVGFVKRQV